MLRRGYFRKFHSYLLGCASEVGAPLLRWGGRVVTGGPFLPPHSWKRGLIISHTRIGDVLFRSCSLEALKRGLPDCEWHYLAASDSAEVLRGNPFLESVLPLCDSRGALRLGPGGAAELRQMQFDVALCTNTETYWQDHQVALSAHIANRAGFTHRGLSGLVTHPIPYTGRAAWAAYFRTMVCHLTGVPADGPLIPRIYASKADESEAVAQWRKMGLPERGPVLACFMTTRERSLVWPRDNYQRALQWVHQKSRANLVLCGAKQDARVLTEFAGQCGVPCRVMAGDLGLRGLCCFLRRCSAVLTADSGPRHIANAAGTPVVFIRNLYCSKIETGKYCENEIDLSPDADFVPPEEQEYQLRRVAPDAVAETLLQFLDNKRPIRG